jgi:hypothetical protein
MNYKILSEIKYFIIAAFTLLYVISGNIYAAPAAKKETINFTVTIKDKTEKMPLQAVAVTIKKENTVISSGATNHFGRVVFNDVEEGSYKIAVHYLGYSDYTGDIRIDSLNRSCEITINPKSVELNEVVIKENTENVLKTKIDINTGRQVFETSAYHAKPQNTMTNLIENNLAGAVRATTGEVHIRGQHGEFSYLVDGIPVPLGVFGGMNEIVDPKVIDRVTFYTGGFPAEYGGQITALVDIQNKVPFGKFHMDLSTYAGSYMSSGDSLGERAGNLKNINMNGQSISLSNHTGKFGYFLTASRMETDRRIDQPVNELFHNHGFDYFLYGKFDYLITADDYITANLNYSRTKSQVPYDPNEGFISDEQDSYNSFQTISYFHTISSVPDRESNIFAGGFIREGGLKYTPNVNNDNRVFLEDDTVNSYVIKQNRSFVTSGLRGKYDDRISHYFKYSVGFNYSYLSGSEDFRFINSGGEKLKELSDYSGYDAGLFFQAEVHPFEWTKFDIGGRYDIHNAPSIPNTYQFSPRVKWSLFIDDYNTFSVSYDHLFMPTNIESLSAVASVLGENAAPTMPEKDDLFEFSYLRNWQSGFNTKISWFYKESTPGLDDETYGSSTIRVAVNIEKIKVSGIEFALTYSSPETPFSGFVNSSLIHAYGYGAVSGGFIPAEENAAPFDLDHDQRLSTVIGLNYQPENWFANLSAIYGSGLTNGNEDYNFKTSLFDFNNGAHTPAYWVVNLSAGYTFNFSNGHSIEPSLYVNNIFDNNHLIKGSFFSEARYEERRNLILKISYHI